MIFLQMPSSINGKIISPTNNYLKFLYIYMFSLHIHYFACSISCISIPLPCRNDISDGSPARKGTVALLS